MGKKKGAGKPHATQSFEQMVANATLAKFKPYIDSQVNEMGQQIAYQQKDFLENLYLRIRVLEDIVVDKLEGIDRDVIVGKIADLEDKSLKLEKVDGGAEKGDRVRLEVLTKTKEQEEYQGSKRLMLENTGSGQTLGEELEGLILGMSAGETKEAEFGQDKGMDVKFIVDRVSRPIKVEESNADSNAG